jgi:acyl-coenzyme A thioesterase PaaI-like protein
MLKPIDLLALFKKMNHFDEHMGFYLELDSERKPYYQLKIQQQHCSSPGVAHGAVIAAMMDAQLGILALSHAVTLNQLCSTVELKTNFLNPALVNDSLIGSGTVDFTGKSLVVVSAWLKKKETQELVAKGMGTFNLYPMDKKADLLKQFIKPNKDEQ